MNAIELDSPEEVERKRKGASARKRQRDGARACTKAIPNGTWVSVDTFDLLNSRAEDAGIGLGEVIEMLVAISQIGPDAVAAISDIQEALGVDSHAEVIDIVMPVVAASNLLLKFIERSAGGHNVACDTGSHRRGVQSQISSRLLGD